MTIDISIYTAINSKMQSYTSAVFCVRRAIAYEKEEQFLKAIEEHIKSIKYFTLAYLKLHPMPSDIKNIINDSIEFGVTSVKYLIKLMKSDEKLINEKVSCDLDAIVSNSEELEKLCVYAMANVSSDTEYRIEYIIQKVQNVCKNFGLKQETDEPTWNFENFGLESQEEQTSCFDYFCGIFGIFC